MVKITIFPKISKRSEPLFHFSFFFFPHVPFFFLFTFWSRSFRDESFQSDYLCQQHYNFVYGWFGNDCSLLGPDETSEKTYAQDRFRNFRLNYMGKCSYKAIAFYGRHSHFKVMVFQNLSNHTVHRVDEELLNLRHNLFDLSRIWKFVSTYDFSIVQSKFSPYIQWEAFTT